jgi:hypothetical protein
VILIAALFFGTFLSAAKKYEGKDSKLHRRIPADPETSSG